MATTAQLMAALEKLTADGEKFPGMPSVKTIIENYIKKKYPEYEQFDTAAERKKFIDDTYKVVEQEVKMQIYVVKSTYAGIVSGIEQVKATVKATIAGAAIPSVITTPPAVSAPNPLSALQEASAKVNQMLAILNNLVSQFVRLLAAAIKIELTVPDAVVALIDVIATIRQSILAIPTV